MALNDLTYCEIDGGTPDNPLVLSPQQIEGLINLSKKDGCTSDVRGYITTDIGHISAYQKHLLETAYPGLHILVDYVDPDVWDINFTNNSKNIELLEGGEVKFGATGIDMSLLHFEITHDATISNVQNRVRIEGDTIKCTAPTDNSTWTDQMTVRVYPSYDPTSVKTLNVTVVARRVTGLELVKAVDSIGADEDAYITVNLLPADNTKRSCVVFEAEVDEAGGSVTVDGNRIRYHVSPIVNAEGQATVTARAKIPGLSAAIASGSTTFNIILPTLRVYITKDTTVSDSEHRVTVRDNATTPPTITQLGDGESMRTAKSRTYEIVLPDDEDGFTKEVAVTGATLSDGNTFVAPSGIVTISVNYATKQPDVYVVYSDNTYEEVDNVISRGALYEGKTLEAFCVETTDCVVTYNVNNEVRTTSLSNNVQTYPVGTPSLTGYSGQIISPMISNINNMINNYSWVITEGQLKAYLGDAGEQLAFYNNLPKINRVLRLLDMSISRPISWLPFASDSGNPWEKTYCFNTNNSFSKIANSMSAVLLVFYNWTPRKGTKL